MNIFEMTKTQFDDVFKIADHCEDCAIDAREFCDSNSGWSEIAEFSDLAYYMDGLIKKGGIANVGDKIYLLVLTYALHQGIIGNGSFKKMYGELPARKPTERYIDLARQVAERNLHDFTHDKAESVMMIAWLCPESESDVEKAIEMVNQLGE